MNRKNISLIVSLVMVLAFICASMLITAPRGDIVHAQTNTIILLPDGNATGSNVQRSGCTSDYECVDEDSADDDGTYVYYAPTSGTRSWGWIRVNIEDPVLPAGSTISAVRVHARGKRTSSYMGTAIAYNIGVRLDGNYDADTVTGNMSSSYTTYSYTADRPGGGDWQIADLEDLQAYAGMYVYKTLWARTTQLWVEIDYEGPPPTDTPTPTATPTATPNCTAIATDCAYCAPEPTATPACDDYNFTLENDGWHGFGNHIEFELSHSYTNSVNVNDMLVYWSPAATVAAHDGYTLAIGSLSTTGGWTCDPADSYPDTASFDECPNGVWLPYEVSNSSSNADFGAFVHTSLGGITHGTTLSTDYGIRLFLDNGCQVVVTPAPRAFDTPTPTPTATPPPTSEWGCEWVSATANLPWDSVGVYTWTVPYTTSGVIEDVRVAPAPGTNIAEGYFWVPDTSGMDVGGYCGDGVEWYAPVRAVSGVAEQDAGGASYTVGELEFCMSSICAPTATPPDCADYSVDTSGIYAGSDVNINVYNNSDDDAYVERVVVDWQYAAAQAARNCDEDLYAWVLGHVVGAVGYDIWIGADYTAPSDIAVSPALTAPASDLKIFTLVFAGADAAFAALDGEDDFGATVYLDNGCVLHDYAAPSAYATCTPTPTATETPDCAEYDVAVTEMIYSVPQDLFEAYRVTLTNTSATTVTIERISVDWWPVKTGNAVLYGDLTTNIDWLGWTTSTNHVWGLAGEDGINDPMPETDTALDLPATFVTFTLPSMTYGDLYIDFDSGSQEYFTSTYALDNIGVQVYLDNGCVINTAPVTGTLPECPESAGECAVCCQRSRAWAAYELCLEKGREQQLCDEVLLYLLPE